jgi:hypothetical protein
LSGRRLELLALSLGLTAVLAGCDTKPRTINTSAYRGVDQGVLLAFAWGGAAGFKDSDPSEVEVVFAAEPGDAKQRLMSCNPRNSDCKSLDQFEDTRLAPERDEERILRHFDTDVKKQDLVFLVVADRGSRLVTSDVIRATAASRPTAYSADEIRYDRTSQLLSWPRVPDNDEYVVTVEDDSADRPLSAIATRRKSWTYPELQGIVQYFHDPAKVGELRNGGRYDVVLYSINKQNWATLITNAVVKP